MPLDLSQFTTEDLKALQSGDLSKVSTKGLQALQSAADPAKLAAHNRAAADTSAWQATINPAEDMGGLGRFVAGYGKAGADLVTGLGQRVNSILPDASSTAGKTVRAGLMVSPFAGALSLPNPSQGDVDEQKRLDQPLMGTLGGRAGNLVGSLVDTAPTMLIPGANGVGGAAAIGAATGAIQPTATGDSVVKNAALGGLLGAGGNLLAKGAGAVYRGGKALLEPFTSSGPDQIAGRTLARFADDPNLIGKATSQPTETGALPTLAEQTGDIGIARLQDALASSDPKLGAAIQGRLAQNNAARAGKLREMAGEDGLRDFSDAERKATTQPMYEDAFKVIPDASTLNAEQARSIQTLMKSPAVRQAMNEARSIAQNKGTNTGASNATGSVEGLHNMKMSLDDQISEAVSKDQTNKADSIRAARDKLVDFIESVSPDYKAARNVYRDMSAPINEMDVASELLRKGASKTTDLTTNEVRLQPDAFLRALDNPRNLIKQATGRDLGDNLSDVMSPQNVNMIGTIGKELDRSAAVQRAGMGPGSPTATRLASRNILNQVVSPNVLPAGSTPTLGQKVGQAVADNTLANTVVGKATNWLYSGIAEPRIQEALGKAVLSPGEAQKVLDAAAKASVKLPDTLLRRLSAQAQQAPAEVERLRANR